jgi:hypothetical protein
LTSTIPPLLDRATSLERAGAWDEAAHTLHLVYAASLEAWDPASLLEAVVRLGHCHRLAGRREMAVDMLELSRVLGRLHDRAGRGSAGCGRDQ